MGIPKLGVTEAKAADPAIKAVEAWHEAYGTLLVQVHAEYDDDKDETHALLRDRLLSPYEDAAEEERRAAFPHAVFLPAIEAAINSP